MHSCKKWWIGEFVLPFCCGASVGSKQQYNQDLKRIYKREYEFSSSSLLPKCIALFTRMHCTFYQNASHLTRVHCATFYQSALRHEQHEDVLLSFGVDSSEKFCSDLPVNRCEGDRDWLWQLLLFFSLKCSSWKFVNLDDYLWHP